MFEVYTTVQVVEGNGKFFEDICARPRRDENGR